MNTEAVAIILAEVVGLVVLVRFALATLKDEREEI